MSRKPRAQRLDQDGVVEVARVLAVDGDERQARAGRARSRSSVGRERPAQAARRARDLGRERERQIVCVDDGVGLHARIVCRSEDPLDARRRRAIVRRGGARGGR